MTDEYTKYREDCYNEVATRLNFTLLEAIQFGYTNVIDYMISVIGPYDDEIKLAYDFETEIETVANQIIYNYTWF